MHLSIQEVGISEYFLSVAKNEIGGIRGIFKLHLKITSRAVFGTKLKVWVQYAQCYKDRYKVALKVAFCQKVQDNFPLPSKLLQSNLTLRNC